jgi:hypothetical protein
MYHIRAKLHYVWYLLLANSIISITLKGHRFGALLYNITDFRLHKVYENGLKSIKYKCNNKGKENFWTARYEYKFIKDVYFIIGLHC